jgi:hypothetical protein
MVEAVAGAVWRSDGVSLLPLPLVKLAIDGAACVIILPAFVLRQVFRRAVLVRPALGNLRVLGEQKFALCFGFERHGG